MPSMRCGVIFDLHGLQKAGNISQWLLLSRCLAPSSPSKMSSHLDALYMKSGHFGDQDVSVKKLPLKHRAALHSQLTTIMSHLDPGV